MEGVPCGFKGSDDGCCCAQTVNVVLEDGRTVGVQAQQYAVLVMDVPDLRGEAEKRALRI